MNGSVNESSVSRILNVIEKVISDTIGTVFEAGPSVDCVKELLKALTCEIEAFQDHAVGDNNVMAGPVCIC